MRAAMQAQNRTVVITGASAGLGRALALRFSCGGYRVSLIARSQEGLDAAKRDIERSGGEALAFALDVSDPAALRRAADETANQWGPIDIWINNAMVTMFSAVSQMSPEEFRRITEVTYLGVVHGTMAALAHMRPANSGTIIQIGSALSYRAIPLQSAYCGAKFAIRGFTDSLRSELIHDRSKIRITMIQLPAINTPQFDWARNRFPFRPQPLPPIFQPETVAERIFHAAANPPRELWIGFSALKAIAGAFVAPGYLDRYLAKSAYDGQFSEQPAPAEQTDNLFASATFGHAVRGRFSDKARARVLAVSPWTLRLMGVTGLGLLICLLLVLAFR
jgi:NAD(P)-dependent dehydrogenase (short-subunit alcohol dehydrogenase family)